MVYKDMFIERLLFVFLVLSISSSLFANAFVLADPDKPSFSLEYSGVPSAKVGNSFIWRDIFFGGFLESRNESRFNQGVLPNHNWRGYGFLFYEYKFEDFSLGGFSLINGIEHESAHPTMGFNEFNEKAYELIYDDKYRNINLNSISSSIHYEYKNSYLTVKSIANFQYYLFSKNTPELHNTDLGNSFSFSFGVDLIFPLFESRRIFISLFDRYMFKGDDYRIDSIYYDENGVVIDKNESYPIINSTNTFVVKTGVTFSYDLYSLSLYGKFLYGNIFGFVDSREKRINYYVGVELAR